MNAARPRRKALQFAASRTRYSVQWYQRSPHRYNTSEAATSSALAGSQRDKEVETPSDARANMYAETSRTHHAGDESLLALSRVGSTSPVRPSPRLIAADSLNTDLVSAAFGKGHVRKELDFKSIQ